MTMYQVRDFSGGPVILEMEASSANEVPTSVIGDKGLLLDWANDMVASGQSVYLIGTGCGPNTSVTTPWTGQASRRWRILS